MAKPVWSDDTDHDGTVAIAIGQNRSVTLKRTDVITFINALSKEVNMTNFAPLRPRAWCRVGGITCSEHNSNLRISWTIDWQCSIVIERGDIDDLMTALTGARSDRQGKSVQVGSIVVIREGHQRHGRDQALTILRSHAPSDNLYIHANKVDDLMVALDGILGQRETLPATTDRAP